MIQSYVHQKLNQEVVAIGGYYLLTKEVRLPFRGRDLLYLVGHAAFETTCCGTGGCAYALVPGFVVDWRGGVSEDGLPVSRVEPVQARTVQDHLRRIIARKELVHQIVFL